MNIDFGIGIGIDRVNLVGGSLALLAVRVREGCHP